MEISIDPAAAAIGATLIEVASRALSSGAAALPAVTGLAPAGAEEVSIQAAAAFAVEGQAMLALNTAAQEELARAGAALLDIARLYSEVDDAAAGAMAASATHISDSAFSGGLGVNAAAGLLRSATLPGAAGSAARTPLLANLLNGVAAVNPSAMMPAAVGAASTVLGVATGPASMIASLASGAAAGGAAGPALASSVAENADRSEQENAGEQPGEALV
ncbi:PE family protein [Mycobacterium sp. Lab-001]|uniref:PE family protein n=1 Tax=Mycobacterium sp. Lab-001 TaxID=3410136 RepID=UPI003D1742BE